MHRNPVRSKAAAAVRQTIGAVRRAASVIGTIVSGTLLTALCGFAALFIILSALLAAGCSIAKRPVDKTVLESEVMAIQDTDPNRDIAGGELEVGGGSGGGGGSC